MTKWDLFQEYKVGSIQENQSMYYIDCVNRTKDKTHMIISIEAEKAFNKILSSLKRSTTRIRRELLQSDKGHL